MWEEIGLPYLVRSRIELNSRPHISRRNIAKRRRARECEEGGEGAQNEGRSIVQLQGAVLAVFSAL